jgi:hypothetical protein
LGGCCLPIYLDAVEVEVEDDAGELGGTFDLIQKQHVDMYIRLVI